MSHCFHAERSREGQHLESYKAHRYGLYVVTNILFVTERSKVTDCPPAEVVLRRHTSKPAPDITIANMSLSNVGQYSNMFSRAVCRYIVIMS